MASSNPRPSARLFASITLPLVLTGILIYLALRPPASDETNPSSDLTQTEPGSGATGAIANASSHPQAPLLSTQSAAAASVARAAELAALLQSGKDAPTGREFKLGPGGVLVGAPTERTAWLEELSQLDPRAALAQAKTILSAMDSTDEWALSLRIVAQADSSAATRVFLEDRMRAMLAHEPWQQNPSISYLEAFDVAVYVGGTGLLPDLTGLVRGEENRAVAHAAYLALDRLVIRDAPSALGHLEAASESMRGRETTRANFFARADVSDANERSILERYLLSGERSGEELGAFAGLYPNFNYMISHNLLTQNTTPDRETIVRRDRAALGVVGEWLGDPRFARLTPLLQSIQGRLGPFVKQGNLQ